MPKIHVGGRIRAILGALVWAALVSGCPGTLEDPERFGDGSVGAPKDAGTDGKIDAGSDAKSDAASDAKAEAANEAGGD